MDNNVFMQLTDSHLTLPSVSEHAVKWKNKLQLSLKKNNEKGTIQHHINRNKKVVRSDPEKYIVNTTLCRLNSIIQFAGMIFFHLFN